MKDYRYRVWASDESEIDDGDEYWAKDEKEAAEYWAGEHWTKTRAHLQVVNTLNLDTEERREVVVVVTLKASY